MEVDKKLAKGICQQTEVKAAEQRDPRKGFLLGLAATAVVSTNFVTVKYSVQGFNTWTFSMLWTWAAAVYAFMLICFGGKARQLMLGKQAFGAMVCLGLVTATGMVLSWEGLRLLEPAYTAFLWRFAPVLAIVLGAVFLSEKLTAKIIFPGIVMVAGGLVCTIGQWNVVAWGTILTLLACCSMAIQMLIAKIKVSRIHPYAIAFYRVFLAAVVLTGVVLARGKADFSQAHGSHWAVMFLGAFLGPCLSHFLLFNAYRYWDLSRVSMTRVAQPLFVIPLAYVVFGTWPTPLRLIGGFIILAGAIWLAFVGIQSNSRR